MKLKKFICGVTTFVLLLVIWEISTVWFSSLRFVIPPPLLVVKSLFERKELFFTHSLVTLKEMLGGILIALSVAFPFAWIMYLFRTARYVMQPLFLVVQCIPIFTLAPLMVIWFGWSYIAIVIPTALMIFFPLTMTIYEGLKSTPKELLDYFSVNKATPWQLFTKLQLPWAFPQLCAGMRISAAIAGIGAIAGEWAGGQQGLGLLMLESRRSADIETCFAALFCLTLMSLVFFSVTVFFEKRLLRFSTKKILATFSFSWFLVGVIFLSGSIPHHQAKYKLVLEWLPNPDHVPLYVGIHNKIFEKHGIPLEVYKVPDPSNSLGYLANGKVDWAIYYTPDTILAMQQGIQVQPVANLIGKPLRGLIFRKDEDITKPKDLNGKIMGYSIDGTSTRSLDVLLEQNHIFPEKKVNINYDLVTSLGTKQVDCTYGAFWNIECEQLKSLGIDTEYFTVEELGVPDYPELVLLAKEGSPVTEEAITKRLKHAMQESIEFCKEFPEKAFAAYIKENPDKSAVTIEWEKRAWMRTIPLLAESQQVDLDQWEIYKGWMMENGIINP